MKKARALSLVLLTVLYGAPIPVRADVPLESVALPDGRAAETYSANVETVLLEKYRLKIDTATGRAILQWTFVDGDLPAGLTVRADGTVAGTPKVNATQSYRFRVKVVDASTNDPEPLFLDLTLSVAAPRLRLSKVSAPALVPVGAPVSNVSYADAARPESSSEATEPAPAGGGAAVAPAAAPTDTCPGCPTASCATCLPKTEDADRTITIDASTGTVKGARKYKKGQHAQVVIVNKNPYIRAYTVKIDETQTPESALNSFLPLLGPIIADQLTPPKDTKTDDDASKKNAKATNDEKATLKAGGPPPCPEQAELDDLIREKNRAMAAAAALKGSYEPLATKHKAVAGNYKSGVDTLSGTHASCQVLYCTSLTLRDQLGQRVSDASIKTVQDASDALKTRANDLKLDTAVMRRQYPDCPLPILDEYDALAGGLLGQAGEVDASLVKVRDDNKKFEKATETIDKVLVDQSSFAEVYEIPQKRSTDTATVTLSAKGLKSFGGDPEDKSSDIAKVEVQFGDAPYFTASGGIAVSTLEKTEYQRVQGFAANREGQVTGTTVTSIVGVKEDSSTRITPIVMLHGRLYRPEVEKWLGFSGLHWSLGVTGKNDNKGIDIEYLVGPSASFLNDQLFVTVGGYAGKRQTLDGNLFPGAEVPKDLAEIPVHKNYHWKLGFALTYKLPVFK
jgi:hypothetical protein